jgi:hypothetical protein
MDQGCGVSACQAADDVDGIATDSVDHEGYVSMGFLMDGQSTYLGTQASHSDFNSCEAAH